MSSERISCDGLKCAAGINQYLFGYNVLHEAGALYCRSVVDRPDTRRMCLLGVTASCDNEQGVIYDIAHA